MARKEVLIKSVALAISAYPMSCFKLPIASCKDFNSILSNFWWGSNQNGNKLHWKSCDHLCKPKEAGGMSFRNLEHFNMSLLAKQCWRIIQESESLWIKVLKGLYFPNSSFFDAKKGYRASWAWSSLLEAHDLFVEGLWQVNNGIGINIWKDCWLPPPEASVVRVIGNIPLDGPSSVATLIDWDTRTWNLNAISHYIHPNDLQRIISIPIRVLDDKDRFIWPRNKNGYYSVRSGYHWLHGRFLSTTNQLASGSSHCIDLWVWKIIWNIPTLPRIRIFLWKILLGAAPTMYNLARRMITSSPVCPICGKTEETFEHLLLLCPWVDPIWFGSILGLLIDKHGTSFSCPSGSVIEAKATTSLAGIELAASLQLMEITMETDAKDVVEEFYQIRGRFAGSLTYSYSKSDPSTLVSEIVTRNGYPEKLMQWLMLLLCLEKV
ncbi:hypothetical protein ACLB2K_066858 [Fragaria x ananassa]